MTTAPAPKLGAISSWFGSKRNLAPTIVRALGDHRVYWEPCCGSLAVTLAKPVAVMETVNDLHSDLINLARVLADEGLAIRLHTRLSNFIFHEDLFREAAERLKPDLGTADITAPNLGRASDFMVVSWYGRNGVMGAENYNCGFAARYTSNGGHAATRWLSAVDSIPAWHHRLRKVTILRRDAFGLIDRISDEPGCAIYFDPPYLEKGAKYLYDFEASDHERLAKALGRFKRARVVCSYYAHPKLAELYPPDRWSKQVHEVNRAMSSQGGKLGGDKASEVLLVNQPSRGPMLPFDLEPAGAGGGGG